MSLPLRPPPLAGREDLIATLQEQLTMGSAPRMVVVTGIGGVGKTSLAAEYAHRYLAELSVAWLVPAEDPTVLRQALAELAARLGGRGAPDPQDQVVSAHGALAGWPSQWLLIFDNVPDEASVRGLLPSAGPGRVIVTSQSQHWPGRTVLDVPVLDLAVATRFLVSRAGDPDESSALQLAGEVGGLPLALEQAAAYIQASGMTLASYLGLFRSRRAELLDRGEPAGHPSVAATFSLAMSRLAAESAAASGLLRLLAVLAPEPVPVGLLLADAELAAYLPEAPSTVLRPLLGDPVALADAILQLRRFSLITPAGPGLVLVHRLVQQVTRDQMSADSAGEWLSAAAFLVEAAVPDDGFVPAAWPVCAVLLPHAQLVLGLTSAGLWRVAQGLGASGSYAVAVEICRQIADAQQSDPDYGPEHPDTLAARYNLADWIGRAGDPAGERDMLTGLLPVHLRVLGPEHPDTLSTRHNLAQATGAAGDWAGERDMLAELLPVTERVLGAEHRQTLATRTNLAHATGAAGDLAGARDMFAELLPLSERVCGPDHPDALADRRGFARWTGSAGDPAAARDMFAELLPVSVRIQGQEHPDTLSTRHELARWTGSAGDPAAARDMLAELLPVSVRILGQEHPDTLSDRAGLARWTGEAGDPAAARDMLAELLPVSQRIQGHEHPDTLNDRANLARWTGEAGHPAAARDMLAELLPVSERVLGPDHPDTLRNRADLARWAAR